MTPKQNYDWVPPKPWTAIIDTNIFRMIKFKLNGVHKKVYEQFQTRALLGEEIPDLVLKTTDGKDVRLRDYIGKKHLVLEFGAVT